MDALSQRMSTNCRVLRHDVVARTAGRAASVNKLPVKEFEDQSLVYSTVTKR